MNIVLDGASQDPLGQPIGTSDSPLAPARPNGFVNGRFLGQLPHWDRSNALAGTYKDSIRELLDN